MDDRQYDRIVSEIETRLKEACPLLNWKGISYWSEDSVRHLGGFDREKEYCFVVEVFEQGQMLQNRITVSALGYQQEPDEQIRSAICDAARLINIEREGHFPGVSEAT